MRNTFIKTLVECSKNDKDIMLLVGDLGFGVIDPFINEFPDRYLNVGIAEQNMTGIAAGLALSGKKAITYSIGNFPTLRCLEQIRNDILYHNANVKIVCVGGGMAYGQLGMSHHATEDIAIMRALPNIKVFAPGDLIEAEAITKAMLKYDGPCYLRLGKGKERVIHEKPIDNYEIGKAIKLKDGNDVAVFSTGAILDVATDVCDELEKKNISVMQCSFPTVKPIDENAIKECILKCKLIITIEEANIVGGFGSSIAEVMAESSAVDVTIFNNQKLYSIFI